MRRRSRVHDTPPTHWLSRRRAAQARYETGASTSARRYANHRASSPEWHEATSIVRTELSETARNLDRNNPIYQRILNAAQQNVIARGPRVTPNTDDDGWNQAAADIYAAHCERTNFSIERIHDEHQSSLIAYRSKLRDGGVLCYHPFGRTQLFEDGQIVTPRERIAQSNIKDGVQFSKRTGALEGYWVGPYSRYGTVKESDAFLLPAWHVDKDLGITLPRTVYLHTPKFITGYRGISPTAAAGDDLERMNIYWEAINERAIQEANAFGVLYAKDRTRAKAGMNVGRGADDANEPGQEEYDSPAYTEPGTVFHLHPEDKFEMQSLQSPNAQLDMFLQWSIRIAAISADMPIEVAMMLFGRNFSASRATVEMFKMWARVEKAYMAKNWTRWDYVWTMYDHMILGDLPYRADWQNVLIAPDGWTYLDPKSEALAIQYRFGTGEATMTEVLADTGRGLREHYDMRANDYLVAKSVADAQNVPIEIIAPHLFADGLGGTETTVEPDLDNA